MPEHVFMSEVEIITDGGRRRRWTAAEKLRIVEGEAEPNLDGRASISVVARRNGVAPNLLYRWRRLMLDRATLAPSNAALVARAVEIAARRGRRPATCAEARAILGLAPAAEVRAGMQVPAEARR